MNCKILFSLFFLILTAAFLHITHRNGFASETSKASSSEQIAGDVENYKEIQKLFGIKPTAAPTKKIDGVEKTELKTPYVITGIKYNTTGTLLEVALESKIKLASGTHNFESKSDFLNYLDVKRTDLVNIRALSETSTIEYTSTFNQTKNRYDVSLLVKAKAEFSILVLPYFKYSDNSGLTLGPRARDYNFWGSLEPLSINADYIFDKSNRHGFSVDLRFSYPIQLAKHLFKISVSESIGYRSDQRFNNNIKTSLNYSYPLADFVSINASISQSFVSETDTAIDEKPIPSKGKTSGSTGVSFRLNPKPIPIINFISYSPSVSLSGEYSATVDDFNPSKRTGFKPSINQSIRFGRVDEVGNFRRGINFSLGNGNSYSFEKGKGWSHSLSFESKFHGVFGKWFGIDSRVYGVQNFYSYNDHSKIAASGSSLGGRLRGVLDDKFNKTEQGLTANLTALFKLFSVKPFVDTYLGIFSDIGVRKRTEQQFSFEDDFKVTVGAEVLLYAIFARAIVIRISYGIDLTKAIKEEGQLTGSNRELFIGIGRYF